MKNSVAKLSKIYKHWIFLHGQYVTQVYDHIPHVFEFYLRSDGYKT